jgi:hypothetical protein
MERFSNFAVKINLRRYAEDRINRELQEGLARSLAASEGRAS